MSTVPVLTALALLSSQPANAPEGTWETISSASPQFSVAMPVRPKTLERTVQSPYGPVEQSVYYAKVDGIFFSAQALRMPEAAIRGAPEAVLDRECRDAVRSGGGKVVRQETLK